MKAPSEKHLEDWIVNNPQHVGDLWEGDIHNQHPSEKYATWINDTQHIYPYFERILKRQARFPFGIADLITLSCGRLCAVELKQGAIDGETVSQVQRYMNALTYIYERVARKTYEEIPDVAKHYNYWETFTTQAEEHVIAGMVVGHSLKDKKLLPLCRSLGIDVVTYDYDPDQSMYWFETEYCSFESGSAMVEVAYDYAEGVLGEVLREIIITKTAERKQWKEAHS